MRDKNLSCWSPNFWGRGIIEPVLNRYNREYFSYTWNTPLVDLSDDEIDNYHRNQGGSEISTESERPWECEQCASLKLIELGEQIHNLCHPMREAS
jgi:hypothetical protein